MAIQRHFSYLLFLLFFVPQVSYAQSSNGLPSQLPTASRSTTTTRPVKLSRKAVVKQSKDERFAAQFWDYLLANNYKHWSAAPGKSAGLFKSQNRMLAQRESFLNNPHSDALKLYVNRAASANIGDLQIGSVVVMENYRSDSSLKSISVMYRTRGYNPDANDWFWVNYNPDGSVAVEKDPNSGTDISGNSVTFASAGSPGYLKKRLMGRSASCIDCHRQSAGTDFAFFNDDGQKQVERVARSK